MSTIENYSRRRAKQPQKGTAENPYTVEEYEAMLEAGTWPGGFVLGIGYCGTETIIQGSSEPSSSEDSSSEYNPSDDKPLIDPDDNDDSTIIDGGNGGNGNTGGNGTGGGTGGTSTGGTGSGGSGGTDSHGTSTGDTGSGETSTGGNTEDNSNNNYPQEGNQHGHGPCPSDDIPDNNGTELNTSAYINAMVDMLPPEAKALYLRLKSENKITVNFIEVNSIDHDRENSSAWTEADEVNHSFYRIWLPYEGDNILSYDNYYRDFCQEMMHVYQSISGISNIVDYNRSPIEFQENMMKWLCNSTVGCGSLLDNSGRTNVYEDFNNFRREVCGYTDGVLSSVKLYSFLRQVTDWYPIFISKYRDHPYGGDQELYYQSYIPQMNWEEVFHWYNVTIIYE